MKKMFLIISVFICLGFVSESWAETTCTWNGTKLTIGGSGTFNGCLDNSQTTATEVTIGTGVTSIGDGAFDGASSLTSITIPKGVTSIGDGAFAFTGLTSITIPKGVTSIGDGAFAFTGLTSITIPDSVTSIGDRAFDSASSLTSITIPKGVTSIGNDAFMNATGLTSITIPEGVTSIGWSAFADASSLESIIIPDNIKTADWDAEVFGYLPEGTNIVCQGDVEKCKTALAKFDVNGNCTGQYCVNLNKIVAANYQQCSGNYFWNGAGCVREPDLSKRKCCDSCKDMGGWCNRIRYTPAEAAQVLRNDNTNEVTITFKK